MTPKEHAKHMLDSLSKGAPEFVTKEQLKAVCMDICNETIKDQKEYWSKVKLELYNL